MEQDSTQIRSIVVMIQVFLMGWIQVVLIRTGLLKFKPSRCCDLGLTAMGKVS